MLIILLAVLSSPNLSNVVIKLLGVRVPVEAESNNRSMRDINCFRRGFPPPHTQYRQRNKQTECTKYSYIVTVTGITYLCVPSCLKLRVSICNFEIKRTSTTLNALCTHAVHGCTYLLPVDFVQYDTVISLVSFIFTIMFL